jgi:hypothetical protein
LIDCPRSARPSHQRAVSTAMLSHEARSAACRPHAKRQFVGLDRYAVFSHYDRLVNVIHVLSLGCRIASAALSSLTLAQNGQARLTPCKPVGRPQHSRAGVLYYRAGSLSAERRVAKFRTRLTESRAIISACSDRLIRQLSSYSSCTYFDVSWHSTPDMRCMLITFE